MKAIMKQRNLCCELPEEGAMHTTETLQEKERREYLFEKEMNKARTLQIKEGVYVQELLKNLSVVRDQ